ncbi:MAG: hypothetical protein N2376_00375 [Clostridia bacterium]|nr:hypothetical protein [Clostridia bacterium]
MITDRDKEIVKFFEIFHFGTIKIIEKVFLREQSYAYNIARTRLDNIRKAGYIKTFSDAATGKNIYALNNPEVLKKRCSLHKLIPIEIYAELRSWGVDIKKFDIEKEWDGGKWRSDAITVFDLVDPYTKKIRRYHFFIEVMLSNDYPNLEKYDKLYSSGAVQEYLGHDFYPKTILLITDRNYNYCGLERCNIIRIETNLNRLVSILV